MTMIKKDGHWVTVAGGQRMWVGTKAQLDAALAAGELEDGTAVMVTDDYEETTSHDPSEVTWNTTYVDLGTWTTGGVLEKCGIVQFTKIFSVKAGIPTGTLICSGLPKPAMAVEIPVAWDGDSAIGGFFLNTNGDLASWATVTADTNCRINLVYIKA